MGKLENSLVKLANMNSRTNNLDVKCNLTLIYQYFDTYHTENCQQIKNKQ